MILFPVPKAVADRETFQKQSTLPTMTSYARRAAVTAVAVLVAGVVAYVSTRFGASLPMAAAVGIVCGFVFDRAAAFGWYPT